VNFDAAVNMTDPDHAIPYQEGLETDEAILDLEVRLIIEEDIRRIVREPFLAELERRSRIRHIAFQAFGGVAVAGVAYFCAKNALDVDSGSFRFHL
jgi:hypothetical protein